MSKSVYGIYESSPLAVKAIRELESKGYEGHDIIVVADKEDSLDLRESTAGDNVRLVSEGSGDESFLDKVIRFFSGESEQPNTLEDKLTDYGVSRSDTAVYAKDIEKGHIVVLVEQGAAKPHQTKPYTEHTESPGLQTMDRYNTGLGLVDQPDPNLAVNRPSVRGELREEEVLETEEERLQKEKLQLNDSSYEGDRDTETSDPLIRNRTNTHNL